MKTLKLGGRDQEPAVDALAIPERFANRLLAHLLGNLLDLDPFPLILAVWGDPGHGKSAQITALVRRWGGSLIYLSGSRLETPVSAGATRVLQDAYRQASMEMVGDKPFSCLMIDDADAGIGDFGERVTYTLNRQNVSSALMNLADHPDLIGGIEVKRIPVIITANRLDVIYEPLVREGRMRIFNWRTSDRELLLMVQALYRSLLSSDECSTLVARFTGEPIAFFAGVKAAVDEIRLLRLVSGKDPVNVLRNFNNGSLATELSALRDGRLGLDEVMTAAEIIRKERDQALLSRHGRGSGT